MGNAVVWLITSVVLPLLISAYGAEIRRFLDALWRKPHQFWLNRQKNKLHRLESLHDNPYNLLLYFMWNFVYMAQFLFSYGFAFWIIKLFKPNVPFKIPGMVISGIFGRVIALNEDVYGLYNYEKTTTKLKAEIEKLESKTISKPTSAISKSSIAP